MTEPRRILILTNDTGFGHRSAANAIAAALIRQHPTDCIVEVVNPLDDKRAPAILRDSQMDYDKMVREMPENYKFRYEFSDAAVPNAIVESALTVMLFNILHDLFARFKPHVIVSTHNMYAAPATAVISIHKLNIPYLVVVTDLIHVHRMWLNNAADMLLVPTPEVRAQALELNIPAERVLVTGIPVNPAILEETRDPRTIRRELGWRSDLTTVLVVGSKRVKKLEGVLHILNHSALPIQLVMIAGGDDRLYGWMLETTWHVPAYLYNFVENMPTLLHASDCVVSKAGGLIVTESLACGRPMLLIDVTPGQEEGNAEYLLHHKAGLLARTPDEALEHLFHWIYDPKTLAQYQECARRLGKPEAAFTVAKLVWETAGRSIAPTRTESPDVLTKLIDLLTSFGLGSDELPGGGFRKAEQ